MPALLGLAFFVVSGRRETVKSRWFSAVPGDPSGRQSKADDHCRILTIQGVFTAAPVTEDAQLLVNLGLVNRDCECQPYWQGWVEWMRASGWRRFGWYVWDQGRGLPGDWNGRLAPSHEFIFHFNRAPRKPHKTVRPSTRAKPSAATVCAGADGTVHAKTGTGNAIQSHRIPDSIFRIMRHKGGLGAAGSHPAVFPVALVEAVLTAFSDPGDLIYEPFCGSGTQIVAAERAGRRCFAIELDRSIATSRCGGGRWPRGGRRNGWSLDRMAGATRYQRCGKSGHLVVSCARASD